MDVSQPYSSSLDHLVEELARVECRSRELIARSRARPQPSVEPLAAYYVPEPEVDGWLAAPPGPCPPCVGAVPEEAGHRARIDRRRARTAAVGGPLLRLDALRSAFGLSGRQVDALLVCLAPEVDRRYERLYGYVHDDLTRRVPTVDLLLTLTCSDLAERVAGRADLAPGGHLVRAGLVAVEDEPGQLSASLLDRSVRLHPRVAAHLLGDDAVPPGLSPYLDVAWPPPADRPATLPPLPEAGPDEPVEPVVVLNGEGGSGRWARAAAWCLARGRPMVTVRTDRLVRLPAADRERVLVELELELTLREAVPFWARTESLLAPLDRPDEVDLLLERIGAHRGPVFLAASASHELPGWIGARPVLRVDLPVPGPVERERLWREALHPDGGDLDLRGLAAGYRFTPGRIHAAVATARRVAGRSRGEGAPTGEEVHAAARMTTFRVPNGVARRVEPRYDWSDLVLDDERASALRQVVEQVRLRSVVHDDWAFAERVVPSRGLTVLFAGAPGTGKTMAASVIARELGVELYAVDLASTVSKYLGETEKNLSAVFAEAHAANAILFFDEADALFGKRTQVRDAHDRYANLETSYLLQKLENHEGTVVLATNLRKNMDEAFVRRLQITIEFPLPGVEERLAIWRRIWPAQAPLHPDVDLAALARDVALPGGNIRNIALAAAFLAAAEGGAITMDHLGRAARLEYRKMGSVQAPVSSAPAPARPAGRTPAGR